MGFTLILTIPVEVVTSRITADSALMILCLDVARSEFAAAATATPEFTFAEVVKEPLRAFVWLEFDEVPIVPFRPPEPAVTESDVVLAAEFVDSDPRVDSARKTSMFSPFSR